MFNPNYILDSFSELPGIIKLIWIVGLFLLVITILQIIGLFFIRRFLRFKEWKVKQYRQKAEKNIINYLYSQDCSEQSNIIRKLLGDVRFKIKRDSILYVLLKLRRDISGEMAGQLEKVYLDLNLAEYSIKNIKSSNWFTVAKAIKELRLMHVKGLEKDIEKLLHHEKTEIQREVQLYYVTVNGFKGLNFLDNFKFPLSDWQQIQLLGILSKIQNEEIQDITSWLSSKNESVVLFALKLAKQYNQIEAKNNLLELLKHSNQKVRIETLKVISYLGVFESKEIIKDSFETMSKNEQLRSLNTISKFTTVEDKSFLLKQSTNKNFCIRFLALKTLNRLFNKQQFNKLFSKVTNDQKRMLKYVKNH